MLKRKHSLTYCWMNRVWPVKTSERGSHPRYLQNSHVCLLLSNFNHFPLPRYRKPQRRNHFDTSPSFLELFPTSCRNRKSSCSFPAPTLNQSFLQGVLENDTWKPRFGCSACLLILGCHCFQSPQWTGWALYVSYNVRCCGWLVPIIGISG